MLDPADLNGIMHLRGNPRPQLDKNDSKIILQWLKKLSQCFIVLDCFAFYNPNPKTYYVKSVTNSTASYLQKWCLTYPIWITTDGVINHIK